MNAKLRAIPFRVGGPIQSPVDFAGRTEVLRAISNAMLNLQNVSLHGERRTGKTSLLLYLAHPAASSVIGLPETHVPVYLDFQDLAEAPLTTVWQAIADAIAEQIRRRHPDRETEYEDFLVTVSEFLSSSKAPALFGTAFGRALAQLDDSGLKIHLLFDEFDQTFRNPELGDPFYDSLRSLPTRSENVSYVIATRTGLTALQPVYDKVSSPLFNIFTRVILRPFEEDEVHRLIFDYFARAGLDISLADSLYDQSAFLRDATGYHPFFLQTLCYHLCTKLDDPDWPLGRARQEALQAFEKDSEPHFEYYWKVSSKKEQGLIKRLAAGDPIDWDHIETSSMVESLKDRCLVVQADKPDQGWRPFSSSFSSWIAAKATVLEEEIVAPKPGEKPAVRRVVLGAVVAVGVVVVLIFVLLAGIAGDGSLLAQVGTPTLTSTSTVMSVSITESDTPLLPAMTPTDAHSGTPSAIAKRELEVRSGPGEEYELLGYLPKGALAEIVSREQEGQWWQIKTDLGSEGSGWIRAGSDFSEASDTGNLPIALAPSPPTPTPTETQTPTPAPTPTERVVVVTATPLPATSTSTRTPNRVSPTPTPTPGASAPPTAIPAPTLPAGQFALLKPASVENPTVGPTEFEWQWNGPVGADQGFEVRVWREGEPPAGVHNAVEDNQNGNVMALGDNTYRLNVDISDAYGVQGRSGEYLWTVILVQISPEYRDLGTQAPLGRLRLEVPSDSDDDAGKKPTF
jgi:hypothetical protein